LEDGIFDEEEFDLDALFVDSDALETVFSGQLASIPRSW